MSINRVYNQTFSVFSNIFFRETKTLTCKYVSVCYKFCSVDTKDFCLRLAAAISRLLSFINHQTDTAALAESLPYGRPQRQSSEKLRDNKCAVSYEISVCMGPVRPCLSAPL